MGKKRPGCVGLKELRNDVWGYQPLGIVRCTTVPHVHTTPEQHGIRYSCGDVPPTGRQSPPHVGALLSPGVGLLSHG
jgi:hypothetical protein